MNNTQNETIMLIKKDLIKPNNLKIIKDLFPKNKKFEEEIKYYFPCKKKNYFGGFNEFAKAKKLFSNEILDWKKVTILFRKTIYSKIFEEITKK